RIADRERVGRRFGYRKQHAGCICAPAARQDRGGGRTARTAHGARSGLLPRGGGGMMRLSLRQRLTAWYAAALLLGLAILAISMWVMLRERLIAGVDARLAQRVRGFES